MENINNKKAIDFNNVGDLFNYLFGENVFIYENDKNSKSAKNTTNEQQKYIPQIGDTVIVTDGDFKGIQGEIIAEIELYNAYQIKVSDINAIYVDKDKVRVIERKVDNEKVEKINKLKEEIRILSDKKIKMRNELDIIENKIDDLYKKLEELED